MLRGKLLPWNLSLYPSELKYDKSLEEIIHSSYPFTKPNYRWQCPHPQRSDFTRVSWHWSILNTLPQREAFEKCWAHSPLRAAALPFTRCRYCRPPPLSHAACASMSTTTSTTTTTTTRDRGDRYGPIKWAQLGTLLLSLIQPTQQTGWLLAFHYILSYLTDRSLRRIILRPVSRYHSR